MTIQEGAFTPGDEQCLHCAINWAIGQWVAAHGPRDQESNLPVLEAGEVIACLSQIISEMIEKNPSPIERAQFQQYARDCLTAAFDFARNGTPIEVRCH